PDSIQYLEWGEEGYTENHPSGYDVRDLLGEPKRETRKKNLEILLNKIKPVPENSITISRQDLKPKECTSFEELLQSWKKALNISLGIECSLVCMLSCAVSTSL